MGCPASGSPPHVRGKAVRTTPGQPPAGKSISCSIPAEDCQDHPRVCGEKQVKVVEHCNKRGSPPHMRGKDSLRPAVASTMGITPAHAGKSTGCCKFSSRNQDHPRMCGEKFGKWSTKGRITGSPPYVRGKEQGQVMPGFAFGITPAYAGKRPVTRPLAVSDRDHPRMCGEKYC